MTVTDGRNARRVSWPLPVLLLVIAFTSIPTELRPVSRAVMHEVFDTSLDIPDILANVIGFIPLGVVLAARGARSAIGIAACVSIFAETTQLFSLGRSPSLIDVATNVIGAALGVAICARWNIRLAPLLVTRPIAAVAAVLAIAYAGVGAQIMPNDVENALAALMLPRSALQNPRGATAPGRLEARWTFDRIDGHKVPDDSGNGWIGVLINQPALVTGVEGHAVALNGKNQYVNVADPFALRLVGSMTISAWIRATAFPRDDAAIASTYAGSGYELDATREQGVRTVGFKLTDASGRLMARYGRTPLQVGRWYHVAGVYDAAAATLDVYVNGRRDSGCLAGHVTNRQLHSASDVFIGRRGGESGYEFTGAIDDVRIYSRALNQTELEEEIAPASTRGIDLSVAGSLDDGTCRAEPDLSYARVPGPVTLFGLFVSVAVIGFWPGTRYRIATSVLSLASGIALIPIISAMIPPTYVFVVPLLTLASGLVTARSATP